MKNKNKSGSVSLVDGHIDRKMTPQEAITRIKNHNEIHSKAEKFAIHITEALNMAIEALEKQRPKKVKMFKNHKGFGACSVCGCAVQKNESYCLRCGQALNWSAESEGDD